MRKEKKIQDNDGLYNFLRYYVDTTLKLSYHSIKYEGLEKLPQDGAIIYAPNHTNALMDALIILAIDRKPKVYVARADIFKNRRLAKIFTFLKIMPIMRMRDGLNEVKKNQETISKAVDVLRDRIPFCIFPEGTHQAKYSSLPLSKGIFRIAFQAQEMMPDMPLYIVPVGLRYGNFFRFRSTVRVQIGDPINVGEFLSQHSQLTTQEQMNKMKDLLEKRLHSSILYIPNDQDYDAVYEICNAAHPIEVKQLLKEKNSGKDHGLNLQFKANNRTIERISILKERNASKASELLKLGNEASSLRRSKGISIESVSIRYPVYSRIIKILFVLLTLPYSIPVSILAQPVLLLCRFLFTILKDSAFWNSVRFLVYLVLWPVLMIVYSIVAYSLLPWEWALPVTLLLLPAPIIAHELWNISRLVISDIKLLKQRRLKNIYSQIKEMILN
ncbi:MAG: 1-acyl-sn-glycerol-3-phosphate acyltransferase [Bacteroidales bacterium]|nr:1-acyl-sn-glycerol-3-phosphate acyltransferase [Bacteroidales bacterium]